MGWRDILQVPINLEKEKIENEGIKGGPLVSQLSHFLVSEKESTQQPIVTGNQVSPPGLPQTLGNDWHWIKENTTLIVAFSNAITQLKEMQSGLIPSHYTSKTTCRHCGEVPIPPGLANGGYVLGCPWCCSRIVIPKLQIFMDLNAG